jgi:hypothetical protein
MSIPDKVGDSDKATLPFPVVAISSTDPAPSEVLPNMVLGVTY